MKLNGSLSGVEIQRDQLQIGSTAMWKCTVNQLVNWRMCKNNKWDGAEPEPSTCFT
jgi:hypothetical protein